MKRKKRNQSDGVMLFLGGARGYAVLRALLSKEVLVAAVVVLEQGRHEYEQFTGTIIKLCLDKGIPYKSSGELKPNQYEFFLRNCKPDVVFVVSWRYLIPSNCFDIPLHGMYVLHDSLLPRYRGFCPTNWVIINGERRTGLTMQKISAGVDEGVIVDQVSISLEDDETAKTLNEKFLIMYPKLILKNLPAILNGRNGLRKQREASATYCCKRTPDDGRIYFDRHTSIEIGRLVRGLCYPYPGAFCFYKGVKVIIWQAETISTPPRFVGRIPGRIWRITDHGVDVLTKDGLIRFIQVSFEQAPRKQLPARSVFMHIGTRLE